MKIKTIYIINMDVEEQPKILFACESEKQAIDKLKHLASFWSSDTTVITWVCAMRTVNGSQVVIM